MKATDIMAAVAMIAMFAVTMLLPAEDQGTQNGCIVLMCAMAVALVYAYERG